MAELDQSPRREIIKDFADAIQEKKDDSKPSKAVINFRDEQRQNKERDVYRVKTELLRFRKHNGRISSDVLSYEKQHEPIHESNKEGQELIKSFLERKDPEKTQELMNSLKHDGQKDPAIITADGFLINGNRRKMALEKLYDETKEERFEWMKVVILPGKDDPGGPPTLKEIEKIENRYQLQTEGKADYYNFDTAISMRNKIRDGFTLEEQLRDNPNYANFTPQKLKNELNKVNDELLKPLECVDEYLSSLGRSGLYNTVSSGIGDREGKWQAFIDFYNSIGKKISNDKDRLKMGIDETDVGVIKDVAFKLIRHGAFPDSKIHQVMRDMGKKWLPNSQARNELFKLKNIPVKLPSDLAEKAEDEKQEDKIWAAEHKTEIMRQVHKVRQILRAQDEREGPINLLNSALERLNDPDLDLKSIGVHELEEARRIAREIQEISLSIEKEIYQIQKNIKVINPKSFKVKS